MRMCPYVYPGGGQRGGQIGRLPITSYRLVITSTYPKHILYILDQFFFLFLLCLFELREHLCIFFQLTTNMYTFVDQP